MAVDYFLKIDGIDGESDDSVHTKEIELSSFDWNESQSGTFAQGGGGGSGKVKMDDFTFLMHTNQASPKLMLACAKGQHIPSAVLTCRKAGGGQQEFLTITMSDVLVSSYKTASSRFTGEGDSGYADGVPMDEVSLNFAKIEYQYRPQKPDGSLGSPVKAGYDLKQNKPV